MFSVGEPVRIDIIFIMYIKHSTYIYTTTTNNTNNPFEGLGVRGNKDVALGKNGYIVFRRGKKFDDDEGLVYKEGSKEIQDRYGRIWLYPIEENVNTPMEEKINLVSDICRTFVLWTSKGCIAG